MDSVLSVVTVMIVVLAATPALAHALELPGKMRLDRDTYFAVQRIYYPGFTVAGFAEILAIVATAALFATAALPRGAVLTALVGLVAMHLVYWLVVHPVNRLWLEGETLGVAGSTFFAAGARHGAQGDEADWRHLRDRWEWGHVVRAVLSLVSLLSLLVALRVDAAG